MCNNFYMDILRNNLPGMTIPELPPIPTSEEEYIQYQINIHNSEKKEPFDGYDCPECFNREYFAVKNPDGGFALRPCKCRQIRQQFRNAKSSGFGGMLEKYTFDNYEVHEAWQHRIKITALDYIKQNPLPWLYIGGQSGAGKSHICTAVGTELLKAGKVVKYVLWRDVFHKFESYRYDEVNYSLYLNELARAEVLVIDDFLKNLDKPKQGSALEIAFDIINRRYNGSKPTIISSEILFTDLEQLDTALHGRIKERCGKYTLSIKDDDTRNYRKKEKRI